MEIELENPGSVRLKVRHANIYEYDAQIARSVHRLHLRPVHDRWQTLVSHSLLVSPDAATQEFEDVFGNWTTQLDVTAPYTKFSLTAESVVELLDVDPFAFPELQARPTIPVSWMPSERMMLAPYLAPVELPETQLAEIYEYAQCFVARNHSDLLETLFDINLTMFRDFAYVPQSTTVETTPFDVLTSKQGVCQDFANLMICMARMLNIPARYVCGYLHTGNSGPTRAGSDASHAWVQLYLPHLGWKAFDPTNGVLPTTGHVRLAVGRHYRDTAPVTGTLYSPAAERLTIEVEVAQVD